MSRPSHDRTIPARRGELFVRTRSRDGPSLPRYELELSLGGLRPETRKDRQRIFGRPARRARSEVEMGRFSTQPGVRALTYAQTRRARLQRIGLGVANDV